MATVVWRGSKVALLSTLRGLPAILSGRAPDPLGLSEVFLREIGVEVLKQVVVNFQNKKAGGAGTDGTGAWKPLAEATLERRARKGISGTDILEETARLLASLEPPTAGSTPEQVFDVSPGRLEVGTMVPYGEFHQYGAGRVPARPFLPEDEMPRQWDADIEEAAERGLVKVLQMISDAGP